MVMVNNGSACTQAPFKLLKVNKVLQKIPSRFQDLWTSIHYKVMSHQGTVKRFCCESSLAVGLGEKAPPDTTVSSPESMEEKTSESECISSPQ